MSHFTHLTSRVTSRHKSICSVHELHSESMEDVLISRELGDREVAEVVVVVVMVEVVVVVVVVVMVVEVADMLLVVVMWSCSQASS